ncbi:MAG: gamma carbonic anhydrase family protein [bacterium]|nr:gamma carbonic anhydrase family protein [bacterium]
MRFGHVLPFEGKTPRLADDVAVMHGALVLGDVEIGAGSSVWFNTVVRGDVNYIRIGERSNVQDGSVLHVTHETAPLRIGHDVTIGHMAMLHGCTIEDCVLIGMQATVLDGAIVGTESLVAAGSVVLEGMIIPPRSLVAGCPAKVKRSLTPGEVAALHQSAAHYEAYVERFRASSWK